MDGYFSAILLVQLLTVLVLVSSGEALKCYNTTKACETVTCSDDEAAASSSATFEIVNKFEGYSGGCLRPDWSFAYSIGIATSAHKLEIEIDDILREMNDEDARKYREERNALFDALVKKVNSTEGSYPLCSRSEFSIKIKLPSKTFERSSVVRGCTVAATGCNDFTEKSPSGNIEVHYKTCRYEGDNGNNEGTRIGTTGVLALAPFLAVGIKGLLSMRTPY